MDKKILQIKIDCFKDQLHQGQEICLHLKGGSMGPFIPSNSDVLISWVPHSEIRIGDVVLTYHEGRILCHRVWRTYSGGLQTKPDAMFGLDEAVPAEAVLGKVTAQVINGRVVRTDTFAARLAGIIILYSTFVISPLFPVVRFLKRKMSFS